MYHHDPAMIYYRMKVEICCIPKKVYNGKVFLFLLEEYIIQVNCLHLG